MPSAHMYFDQSALDYIDARGSNRSQALREIITEHKIFSSALLPDAWTSEHELTAGDAIRAAVKAGASGSLAHIYIVGCSMLEKSISDTCARFLRKLSKAQEMAILIDIGASK